MTDGQTDRIAVASTALAKRRAVKTTNVGDASSIGDGLAGWPVVGVVEAGVVDTRYGVSQPGADAER